MKKTRYTEEQKKARREQKNGIALRNKKSLVDYMGGKCCLCGYSKSLYSLDFHHVEEKNFGIGQNICRDIDALREECNLCVLLCKNCHYEVHENKDAFEERLAEEVETHKERATGVKQIKALQVQIREIEEKLGFKIKRNKRKTYVKGPMSETQKAAISKTMKKRWADKRAKASSET